MAGEALEAVVAGFCRYMEDMLQLFKHGNGTLHKDA